MRFSETEQYGKLEWLIRKDGCMHCSDPGCLKACPSPGAIIQYENGIVDFHQENCIGCRSEERRVGKECRFRGAAVHLTINNKTHSS